MNSPVFKAILKYKITLASMQLEAHEKISILFQRSNHWINRKGNKQVEQQKGLSKRQYSNKNWLLKKMKVFLQTFWKSINATFKSTMFLNFMKLADVIPLHKKGRKDLKENYRLISILLTLPKVFKRMFAEISAFFKFSFLKIPMWISERLQY